MNKLPSLKQLQHLLALYDHQHFGHAAAASYVSQSTLSASMINLEETLETRLLERDHKTFIFTPLGEEMVQRARSIIEQADELVAYAKTQGKPMQGKFYIGVIPTIAPFILSELQTACHKDYPDLSLFIREDTTDNVLKYLGEGKLDLIIIALPYPTRDFYTRTLCKDYFKLVLPKDWLNKDFDKEMTKLPEHSVFLLEKEHCLTGHALQACHLRDGKKINPFFATSLHTLTQMVSYQSGITFLPMLAINSGLLQGSHLVSVPLNNDKAYREIGVAWRATSFKTESYNILTQLIERILLEKCAN